MAKRVRTRKVDVLAEARRLRHATIHAAWVRRHPTAATAERSLRIERRDTLADHSHRRHSTPETAAHAARTRQGALARLYASGAIDADQLNAAVDIATIVERIGADVAVCTCSLETRVDTTRIGDCGFFERLSHVRHEIAYTRWRALQRGPIAAVLDMIAGDVGFTVAARRYGIPSQRCRQMLIDALNLWPAMLDSAHREVDAAELAAAHAGLLA